MAVVLLMFDQLAPPSSDDCHRMMFPVFPLSDNVPLLEFEHTVPEPEMEPPTERGLTVIVAAAVFAAGHVPFITDALYNVVVVKLE